MAEVRWQEMDEACKKAQNALGAMRDLVNGIEDFEARSLKLAREITRASHAAGEAMNEVTELTARIVGVPEAYFEKG